MTGVYTYPTGSWYRYGMRYGKVYLRYGKCGTLQTVNRNHKNPKRKHRYVKYYDRYGIYTVR